MAKDEKNTRKKLTKKSTKTAKNTTNPPAKNLGSSSEDHIAKSKKLVDKIKKRKCSDNSSRSSIQSKNHLRVHSNGKPMPSLSELERMYEDSDDDEQSKTVALQSTKSPSNSSQNICTDTLTSPKTIKRIADRMMDLISNLPDPTAIIENGAPPSPPRKRKKSDCKAYPKAPCTSSSKYCTSEDVYKIASESEDDCPEKEKQKFKRVTISKSCSNTKSDNIATWLQDCEKGDNSDGSHDSNKTVDYDYTKTPPASNIGRPQPFSPIPSTSKDRETINRNDQLFNESFISETNMTSNRSNTKILNETSLESDTELKSIKVDKEMKKLETCMNITDTSNKDDIEIIQTPCETIVIDDDIVTNMTIKRKCSNKSEIIECIDIVKSIVKKESIKVAEYSEAIVIDDEDGYNFINDSPTNDDGTEVIDIDNIIAENKAIIEKYSNKNEKIINSITCVDSTTISNLNTANDTEPNNSLNTCDITNNEMKDNIVPVDAHINKNDNIQDVVTNYFSNNSVNQGQPHEILPRNAAGTSLWNKVTQWLENITPNYTINRTSRNRANVDPSNDSVIIIDDEPSPNIPSRPPKSPTPTHSPPRTNSSSKKIMRINGVVQSYDNTLQNQPVDLGLMEDFEFMNVYCSGDDVYITGSEGPPPGFDSSNLIHKRIPVREILKKQAYLREVIAAPSPAKTMSRSPSKNLGDCPICMDSLSNNSVASTICGHVFCMKCIEASFKASGKRCPTCRKVLKKGGYHQLFL